MVADEQMTVTAVASSTLTVARGANGTTAVTHDAGDYGCHVRTDRTFSIDTDTGARLFVEDYMVTPRADGHMVRLLMPDDLDGVQPSDSAPWGDLVRIPLGQASTTIARGAHYDYTGPNGRRGQMFYALAPGDATSREDMRGTISFANVSPYEIRRL